MKHFAKAGPEAAAVTGVETNLCLWRWEEHAWNRLGKADNFMVQNYPAAGRASTACVPLGLLPLPSTAPQCSHPSSGSPGHGQGR